MKKEKVISILGSFLLIRLCLTSAPAVGVVSPFRLNLTVQTFGWFVLA
jgi:hypothetical protein